MVIFLPEIIDINRVDQIGKKKINVRHLQICQN